jgi:tetratricopeptide (TPR) repeat protein
MMKKPPIPPLSRTAIEQTMRDLRKVLAEKNFSSIDETNAFLQTLSGPAFKQSLGPLPPQSPREEAQQLAFEAMEAGTAAAARKLAKRALRKDPDCVDALLVLVGIDSESPRQAIEGLQRAVEAGERSLGAEFFAQNTGHFWGILETHPYMRALQELGDLFKAQTLYLEAIKRYERMLVLNPNDNQGVRDTLLGLYLGVEDLAGAHKLLTKYKEDSLANFAWGKVLERFLSGDLPAAVQALKAARKANRFVELYLTLQLTPPEDLPEMYSPGSKEEAILCLDNLAFAWTHHHEAMFWLLDQLASDIVPKKSAAGKIGKKPSRK